MTSQQRPDQQPLRPDHPQQRPATGGGGEPVEDRLDLVARGVAGGVARAALGAPAARRLVANLAGPRLQVARGAALASGRLPRRRDDGQLHAQPRAQLRAVDLIDGGLLAQAVVDVQRAHPPAPRSATATSSRQVESRPPESIDHDRPGAEQPSRADGVADLLDRHRPAPTRSAAAVNSSVGSEKPFSRTSPIR